MVSDPHSGQNLDPALIELPQFGQKLIDDVEGAGLGIGWAVAVWYIGWAGAPIKFFVVANLK